MTPVDEEKTEAGPGERLRAAREAAGLSVEEVAERLNLLQYFVRALEENNYQRIRGDTFVRGYLRNYARLLGLDPDEFVACWRQARPEAGASSRSRTATREPQRGSSGAGRVGLVLLLLAASALYLFYSRGPGAADDVVVDAMVSAQATARTRVVPQAVPEYPSDADNP